MLSYRDGCCLQRPLDDQTQPRIKLETEAVLAIIAAIESGDLELANSEAIIFELRRIADESRRTDAMRILAITSRMPIAAPEVETTAEALSQSGFKPMDSVHLATTAVHRINCIIKCDDKLLRKAKQTASLKLKILSPLDFVKDQM
jgi:hypothetical protein